MARCSCGLSGTSGVGKFKNHDFVRLNMSPIDRQISNPGVPNGSIGQVTPISFGSTSRVSLPGPGGGLVYVQWYDEWAEPTRHIGVTSRALTKLSKAEGMRYLGLTSAGRLDGLSPIRPKLPKQIEIHGRRWFQKTFGNTYHSVVITVDGRDEIDSGVHYGYGEQYMQTAAEILVEHGYLPPIGTALWRYCQKNGIRLAYDVVDVKRKKDL
jgi:hypothetical protein